jgi:6-phosphogluconolactonase
MLLGLGEDGHTASLFPGTTALQERKRLVTELYVEKLGADRITMTYPVINAARHVLFLVSGKSKAPILREIFQQDTILSPAQGVRPVAGEVSWMIDRDASSLLSKVTSQ